MKTKNITTVWLIKNNACAAGVAWFASQKEKNEIKVIQMLVTENHFDWANWTLIRRITPKQRVAYAIYAAKIVLGVFEEKWPNDDRPRKAVEAAERCLRTPSKKNRADAADAADAAYTAAYAAASAAYAAASAAYAAAYAAASAADAADVKPQIINYGITLLEKK